MTLTLACGTSVYAVDSGVSPAGYSGALSTPNAESIGVGDVVLAYTNSIDAQAHHPDFTDHNYVLGIGLLPYVEVFGRLADRSYDNPKLIGLTDLSTSIKFTVPDMPWLVRFPHPALKPHLAVGVTDIAGKAQKSHSYYGVASWQYQKAGLSLGYAETADVVYNKTNVDGIFGSVTIQPTDWLQGIAEYNGQDAQVGVRVMSPQNSLPLALRIAADVRYDLSNEDGKQAKWGVSVQRPLAFVAERPQVALNNITPTTAEVLPLVTASAQVQNEQTAVSIPTHNLEQILKKQGFQDIRFGTEQDTLVISVENQSYLWNDLDAIGAILAAFYNASADMENVKIILNKQQIPVMMVSSQRACLATWQQQTAQSVCKTPVLHHLHFTPQQISAAMAETQWINAPVQSSSLRPRIGLSPILNYTLGTEYGVLDYSLGMATTVEIPLWWQGLLAETQYTQPIEESADFKRGGVFYDQRLQAGIKRAMLHQYLRHDRMDTHVAVGQLYPNTYGSFVEGQFNSDYHQFSATLGYFEQNNDTQTRHQPMLLGYRYQIPYYDAQIAVKAGEFFDGDRGLKVESRFMFADTDVNIFFQKTKHDQQQASSYVGLEIALPLTPRRAYTHSVLQIKGSEEYKQSFMTRVNHRKNYVEGSWGNARLFDVPYNIDDILFNRDRLSRTYILQHTARIQQVFQQEIHP